MTRAARRRRRRRFFRGVFVLPPLRAVMRLLALCSPVAADRAGRALGRALFRGAPRLRARTLRHLASGFPDRSPAERRRIGLESFQLLVACALEWLVLCRWGKERAAETVRSVSGWEHVEAGLARGRGLLIITAHFGLFELITVAIQARGVRGKVVVREHNDPGIEELITELRRRMGVETFSQDQVRGVVRELRKGGAIGALPDQDLDKLQGIFLPFFGREAYTPSGPATLAVLTGATLLPVFLHRWGPARHHLEIKPPIPDPGGPREERVRELTRGWSEVFEREIAAHPGHWAWLHRRWATTPELLRKKRERRRRGAGEQRDKGDRIG